MPRRASRLDLPLAWGRRRALSAANRRPHAKERPAAARESAAASKQVQRMIIAAHVLES